MTFFLGTNVKLMDELVKALCKLGYTDPTFIQYEYFDTDHIYIAARANGEIAAWEFSPHFTPEEHLTGKGLKIWNKDKKHLTPIEEILFWKDPNSVFDKI